MESDSPRRFLVSAADVTSEHNPSEHHALYFSLELHEEIPTPSCSTSLDKELDEAALLNETPKPATTVELMNMLKKAGTELTVKYITGEITFEDFCHEMEKTKASKSEIDTTTKLQPLSTSSATTIITRLIPAFDRLFEQGQEDDKDEEEEDDGEDDEEEEEEDEEGEDEAEEMEVNLDNSEADFVDAGEILDDDDDDDWNPNGKIKKLKGTSKRKTPKGNLTKRKLKSARKASNDLQIGTHKRPRKKRKRMCDLPKHLNGANGRAMLMRAQGNTDEAIVLLYDIINKAPKAAGPYQTLGNICEEQGNMKQALKFYMVAASLRASHATEWVELAEMCFNMKEEKLALDCYTRALRTTKDNQGKIEILTRRCQYFEQKQLPVKALQCKEQILTFMDKSQPGNILSFARNIYNDYMDMGDENGAISVLQYILKDLPNDIDSEDVHNLAELLMNQKRYLKCIEIIIKHCGVNVDFDPGISTTTDLASSLEAFEKKEAVLTRITYPPLMPVDLRSKLTQCLVRSKALGKLDVIMDLIKGLTETDVEQYGDIYYDIAETLVECGYHDDARPILHSLVHSEKYSKAAVWLTFGQCLNALGDLKAATEAYRQVVEMAPGHFEARVILSSLLQQMGQHDHALEVLSSVSTNENKASEDQVLLLHKCQLLHSQGKTEEFITGARKLLSFSFPGQFSPEFIRVLLGIRTPKCRRSILPQFISSMKTDKEKDGEVQELNQVEQTKFRTDLWDVYVKLCYAMHDLGLTNELLETATLGLTCPIFTRDSTMTKDAEFMCLKMGPVSINVYHLARGLVTEEKDNNQAWNLYAYIFTRVKEVTDLRFATRALMKNPNSIALGILNGNARLISGTYKPALAEYLTVFRNMPDNDMVLLCTALCFVHIASQSYSSKKNVLVMQAICLLNAYQEMRGRCQETYYNLGRAYHQLDILHAAAHYYKKALSYPPIVADAEGTFDLRREIAYSLAQIYIKSNNLDYARYYIETYLQV